MSKVPMGRRDDDTPFSDPKASKPAILIVEDELLIRMSLADHLEECGFSVLEASNPAEAIRLINMWPVKIDLVFSDVNMPGDMTGIELAQWIGKNRPSLPVILASADAAKADVAQALCANRAFFAKPYDFDVVTASMREIIAAHNAAN